MIGLLPAFNAALLSGLGRDGPFASGRLVANITPGWAVAVLATGAFLFLLYHYERRHSPRPGQRGAWLLRTATATAVLALFAEPQWIMHRLRRPSVVVLIDESASMATLDAVPEEAAARSGRRLRKTGQSAGVSRLEIAQRLLTEKEGLLDTLQARYDPLFFAVGETARRLPASDQRKQLRKLRPTSTSSRLGDAVRHALEMSAAYEPVAAIMLTDGITTRGTTLQEYVSGNAYHGVPLYIVGVGGAQPVPDVAVDRVSADALVLAGESVTVEARIRVAGFKGRTIEARLRDADSEAILARRRVPINDTAATEIAEFQFLAESAGRRRMVVEIPIQSGEARADNNRHMCHVQVTPGPIRVLMVESRPRFEFRNIRSVLRRDERIDLTTILAEADAELVQADPELEAFFPETASSLLDYDVVILGDIDPQFVGRKAMRSLVEFVEQRAGGVMFICGPRFMPAGFQQTPLGALIPVSLDDSAVADSRQRTTPLHVVPTPLGRRTLFRLVGSASQEAVRRTGSMMPVYGAFPLTVAKPGALVLAEAKNGRERGTHACFVTQYVGTGKVLLQAADETWRWQKSSRQGANGLFWGRVVRMVARNHLAARSGPALLAVDRLEYHVGDPVRLSFEPGVETGRTEALTVTLVGDHGTRRVVSLQRDPYQADRPVGIVNNLAEGEYEARADTARAGASAPSTRFTVRRFNGERQRVAVDLPTLRQTAQQTQGRFYQPATAHRLYRDLPDTNRLSLAARMPLWNRWWIMLVLTGFLGAEWLIRRLNGLT